MKFLNRLSGRVESSTRPNPLLGQWKLSLGPDEVCFINDVHRATNTFVVPGLDGHCRIIDQQGVCVLRVDCLACSTLEDERLGDFATLLHAQTANEANWLSWLEQSPVAMDVSQEVDLAPRERTLRESHLAHIERVFQRPYLRLEAYDERLPVAQVKRISMQAEEHLARHTEDWVHRTLRSVVPKRVLAHTVDEQWHTYENRVAARLADCVHRELGKRIVELNKLIDLYDQINDLEQDSSEIYYRRAQRLFRLLAEKVKAESVLKHLRGTLVELSSLQHGFGKMRNSELYRNIPARAKVLSLRMTNLLQHDRHYLHVAQAWPQWYRQDVPTESAEAALQRTEDFCDGFDRFCALLLVRALDHLGYTPTDDVRFAPGGQPLQLNGLVVTWRVEGDLTIETSDGEGLLRLVPLAAGLTDGDQESVRGNLNALFGSLEEPNPNALVRGNTRSRGARDDQTWRMQIVLYPGLLGQRRNLSPQDSRCVNTLENDLPQSERHGVGLLPVSPLDINSVERVGRAIRWVTLGFRILRYPAVVNVPTVCQPLVQQTEWLLSNRQTAKVTRPISDRQWAAFKSRTDELRRRCEIHRDTIACSYIDRLETDIDRALRGFSVLLICPICGQELDPDRDFEQRGEDHTLYTCPSCKSQWGSAACGTCQGRYPFLWPGSVPAAHQPRDTEWVDHVLGCDVLALPCWFSGEGRQFICSACGRGDHASNACDQSCGRHDLCAGPVSR